MRKQIDLALDAVRARYLLHVSRSNLMPISVKVSIGSDQGNTVAFTEEVCIDYVWGKEK